MKDAVAIPYGELNGFPVPKISGHAGELVVGTLGGKEIAVLRAARMLMRAAMPPSCARSSKPSRRLGIETLILTNAAGSLDPKMRPGRIMLITDHINSVRHEPADRRAWRRRFRAA